MKLKYFLLMMLSILTVLPSFAQDLYIEVDGIIYYINELNLASVSNLTDSYRSQVISITVPTYVDYEGNRYSVWKVMYLGNCPKLESVVISDYVGISETESSTFENCPSLTNVKLGNFVVAICKDMFKNCTSLINLEIPNSVRMISYSAFEGCTSLNDIKIPNSVTEIGDRVFDGCTSLQYINIPSSVTKLGYSDTFGGASALTYIYVDPGNKFYSSVDGILFNKDQSRIIRYPMAKKDLAYTIPSSVTEIGMSAFEDCSGLTSIEIPSSVTEIGRSAFEDCSGLTSIEIGSSMTEIGRYAFGYCSNIEKITCYAVTPPKCDNSFYKMPTSSCVLYVPSVSIDAYREAEGWKDFQYIEPIPGWEPEPLGGERDCNIHYLDHEQSKIDGETATITLPEPEVIEGYTFSHWQVLESKLDEGIFIQAVYNATTSVSNITSNKVDNSAQKVIKNGQVYVIKGNKQYTLDGVEVR